MKQLAIICLSLCLFSAPAYATWGGSSNNNTNVLHQKYNPHVFNKGVNKNHVNNNVNNRNVNRNNNTNNNANVNVNNVHNSSKSRSTSNSTSNSNSKSRSNSNSSANNNNTVNATGGNSKAKSNATGGDGGDSNVVINDTVTNEVAASSAYAPALTSSDDTCMGSSSVGGQGVGFGLSLGTTWEDEDCRRRKNARFMHNMQQTDIAVTMMCEDDEVYQAVMIAGNDRQKYYCKISRTFDVTGEEVKARKSKRSRSTSHTNSSRYND